MLELNILALFCDFVQENLKALEVAKSSAEAELARVKKDKDTLKEIVESGHVNFICFELGLYLAINCLHRIIVLC